MSTFSSLSEQYLNFCQYHKQLSPKTVNAYRMDLRCYDTFLRKTAAEAYADRDVLNSYINHLNITYAAKTVRRKLASLKAFFRYLVFEDILPLHPFARINVNIKQPQPLPKIIPHNVMEDFFNYLYKERDNAFTKYRRDMILRDIAISELLLATGMRISEICGLKKEHLNMRNRTIDIWGKGNRERIIFIDNPCVIRALEEYIRRVQPQINETGYIFINRLGRPITDQTVRLMLNKYVNEAAIHFHITPHMFRHTFATMLLESDVDIRYIQKLLGHSSITTTEIYTSVSIAKQKEILTVKHPRDKLTVAI